MPFATHPPQVLPVVVKPGRVAGDDDVMSLLSNVVLTSIHQPAVIIFTLVLVILQKTNVKQLVSAKGDHIVQWPDLMSKSSIILPFLQTTLNHPPCHLQEFQ